MITSDQATAHAKQHRAPCSDCPWARAAIPGWIGPNSIEEWLAAAHSDTRINCHTRREHSGKPWVFWQCAGAAIYRANVCKSTRGEALVLPANKNLVFTFHEFEEHHGAKKILG